VFQDSIAKLLQEGGIKEDSNTAVVFFLHGPIGDYERFLTLFPYPERIVSSFFGVVAYPVGDNDSDISIPTWNYTDEPGIVYYLVSGFPFPFQSHVNTKDGSSSLKYSQQIVDDLNKIRVPAECAENLFYRSSQSTSIVRPMTVCYAVSGYNLSNLRKHHLSELSGAVHEHLDLSYAYCKTQTLVEFTVGTFVLHDTIVCTWCLLLDGLFKHEGGSKTHSKVRGILPSSWNALNG